VRLFEGDPPEKVGEPAGIVAELDPPARGGVVMSERKRRIGENEASSAASTRMFSTQARSRRSFTGGPLLRMALETRWRLLQVVSLGRAA